MPKIELGHLERSILLHQININVCQVLPHGAIEIPNNDS